MVPGIDHIVFIFAMAFSVIVEILNMRLRKKGAPVNLRDAYTEEKVKVKV